MKERYCALSLGILFLLIGIAGFIPSIVSLPTGAAPNIPLDAPSITFDESFGNLFGLFATNYLHNAVHIAVGVLGIASFTSLSGARVFNRGFAIMYGLLAFMGLIPYANTLFGLMPIYGNNAWFNALTAAIAAYFGFLVPAETKDIEASPSL